MWISQQKPTLLQTLGSVLAALFGVQSNKARARDFEKGNPVLFIMLGAITVIIFVLLLYVLVQWIVTQAGH